MKKRLPILTVFEFGHLSSAACTLLLLLLWISPAIAALLPADFVLRQAASLWKGEKGLVLQREVVGTDPTAPVIEQVYVRDGKVRVEVPGGTWVHPERPGTETAAEHRPGFIDAVFQTSPEAFQDYLKVLGISFEQRTLDRIPCTECPLPFHVVYRIGSADKEDGAGIAIEKNTWFIRELQFRESPEGPLWRAEYSGQGASDDLPTWLPTRIAVYRDGVLFETIKVLRRLDLPIRDSLFDPRASTWKPQSNGR